MIRLRLLDLLVSPLKRPFPPQYDLHRIAIFNDLLITHIHIHFSGIQIIIQSVNHLSLLGNHCAQTLKDASQLGHVRFDILDGLSSLM